MNRHVAELEPVESAAQALVIKAATELTLDRTRAVAWYVNERIVQYHNQTPEELVDAGYVDAVLAYLQDLRNGASG